VIISPPFLPERAAGQSESAWLDVAMAPPASRLPGTPAPEGSFPLSLQLAWHNGLHIQAPQSAGAYLPVRAVADGRVVFVHAPTTPNSDLHHPLNYNPFGASPPTAAWTSDGFMAIEHRTEIGAAQATATEVVYYSVYMHLESLSRSPRTNAPWAPGDAIYRKEVIGMPGQIYGHAGQLHFEICCDETNLRHLTGRAPRWADPDIAFVPATDGRTDSVFGNAYIYLPAGTPTSTHRPSMHVRSALPAGGGASAATDHFPPDTLRVPLWLRIAHEEGNAMLATFDQHGQPIGAPRLDSRHDYIRHTASPTPRGRFEYDLCAAAKDRHDALPSADQARSSASGWYELLRFGRNLGSDPLPADAVHWRKIVTSEGELWVDLNAAGTLKFSDADFPTIAGWNFFDDDGTPSDLRCDSRNLKASIRDPDPSNKRRMEREELVKRLGETQVRARLRRAICRFPTEGDQTEIEASYGWLETADLKPADDDATGARKWDRFVKHAKAVSFLGLPQELKRADWRFHPREFIAHMRACGWLSATEFAQCFPRTLLHLHGTTFRPATTPWQAAIARANNWILPFNKAARKYGISAARQRLLHFFSHVIPETGNLALVKEIAGERANYAPYFGRGLIQLTHLSNYKSYGDFRGFPRTSPSTAFPALGWNPDALIAADNRGTHHADNCVDSACFYVVRRENMLSHLDAGTSQADVIRVSNDVNGYVAIQNLNGLEARLQSAVHLKYFFLEDVSSAGSESIGFAWRRNSQKEAVLDAQGRPVLSGNPPRPRTQYVLAHHTINVSLTRQVP